MKDIKIGTYPYVNVNRMAKFSAMIISNYQDRIKYTVRGILSLFQLEHEVDLNTVMKVLNECKEVNIIVGNLTIYIDLKELSVSLKGQRRTMCFIDKEIADKEKTKKYNIIEDFIAAMTEMYTINDILGNNDGYFETKENLYEYL